MFLTPSDFTGKFELHTGMYVQQKLIEYINRYEKRYLVELLGQKLYDEFINDIDPLTNAPKSPNFQQIFFPFIEDVTLYETINSEGVIDMLKGFIYFEYSKDNFNQQTVYGNVQQSAENSKIVNTLQTLLYNRYNEAITTFRAIRDFIYLHYDAPLGQVVEISQTGNNGETYVNSTNVTTQTNGTGIGLTVDITANQIGGVDGYYLVTPGSGYTDGNYPLIGGTGSGFELSVTADPLTGEITGVVEVINAGSGYTANDVLTLQSGNYDATFEVLSTTNGQITSVIINQQGVNYSIGDVVTIDGGDGLAEIEIIYVGVGNYGVYNGKQKQYAYWL